MLPRLLDAWDREILPPCEQRGREGGKEGRREGEKERRREGGEGRGGHARLHAHEHEHEPRLFNHASLRLHHVHELV